MNHRLSQHPLRAVLHNEIHARPPEGMPVPLSISHVVMGCDPQQREASRAHLAALLRDHHLPLPDPDSNHLRTEIGPLLIRWELHTEFVTWTFLQEPPQDTVSGTREPQPAVAAAPHDWFNALPGQCLSCLNLWVLPARDNANNVLVRHMLDEDTLVASSVADGFGEVYTDFAIHPDGFSRMLLFAGSLMPRRLGRLVQRLLEIETYRMAALLGLPAARETFAVLGAAERELAELAQAIRSANREEEPLLLNRLTKLAGQVESQHAATHSRFSASSAYFELVDKRIADISESRLSGMQTIGEFMERRLTPARSTCAWATRRQDALSQRVSRISNLLRTRVEIEQQQSSQGLLAAMNARQDLQLKLQATVEGLSVAAITYYIVGLIGYFAKGVQASGWPWSAESTMAAAIPVVALGVWWSLHGLHKRYLKL